MKIAKLTIPLLIRLLEFAREDSKTDMDLHFIAEYLSREKEIFSMEDYADIIKVIRNND